MLLRGVRRKDYFLLKNRRIASLKETPSSLAIRSICCLVFWFLIAACARFFKSSAKPISPPLC